MIAHIYGLETVYNIGESVVTTTFSAANTVVSTGRDAVAVRSTSSTLFKI